MKRDRDVDALAEAIERAQVRNARWTLGDRLLGRLARRALVKAGPFALFSVAAGVLLARTGVDLGSLLMPMFYATPLIVAGVVVFIVVAWRQNTGLTWTPPAGQVDLATEPGQVGQANPEVAGQVAKPTTVTVTVLPTPAAALPSAVGQAAPIYDTHPTVTAEEDDGA